MKNSSSNEKTLRMLSPSQNGKLHTLEELAQCVAEEKRLGKKIVHCHGVFDLLHVGHIRHFREARQMGDVLVVTITPDRFVRKGPHRPIFHEHLRAEAIAALKYVDYVAINAWPTAVETIKLLRPDLYVKGPDYRKREDDRTGGIYEEEEAVRTVGGQIAFTDDITFSSSNLINRHLPVFPEEVSAYLESMGRRYTAGEILQYLENAADLRVLVIGEAIIDEYEYCTAIGKSSKEPSLVVQHQNLERFAGGTLAVANHVAQFAGETALMSYLGNEDMYREFVSEKLSPAVQTHFLQRRNSPTIVKKRYVESYFFTKLLEVYTINDDRLDPQEYAAFLAMLDATIDAFDLVIVVDYGHGLLGREAIALLSERARFLAVNAQSNAGNLGYHTISKYSRADLACLTENELRLEARSKRGDLRELMQNVFNEKAYRRLVVTRGKHGCLYIDRECGFGEAPALATQVVDRVGAGDAFLSLAAICAAQNAPMDVLALIGNAAGAQAVATVCNREPVEKISLIRQIETLLK